MRARRCAENHDSELSVWTFIQDTTEHGATEAWGKQTERGRHKNNTVPGPTQEHGTRGSHGRT